MCALISHLAPMSPGISDAERAPAGAASGADSGAASITNKLLCDEECLAKLESLQTQETKTGLKYKDIVVGTGPSPPTGYQVLQRYCTLRTRATFTCRTEILPTAYALALVSYQ